ncbi:MAG: transglycosylase SLT domain-containing protein [Alphaproteobacteria bacterium]
MMRSIALGCAAAVLLALPVHAAANKPVPKPKPALSAFQQEQAMSPAELIKRWHPLTLKASKRFGVPLIWINAVMRLESGGRTMLGETQKMVSDKGALGLMQVLPGTYAEMREQYGLGADVFEPKNNIYAGAAYLKWLRGKYGFPAMFAAYNAGPGSVEAVMAHTKVLPTETRLYLAGINKILGGGAEGTSINSAKLTRPDGTSVLIDPIAVNSIRAVSPGEYAEGVQTVITAGRLRQGVKEDLKTVTEAIRIRGGTI